MAVHRGAFDKTVAPGAFAAFADEYENLPAIYTEVLNIDTTEKAFERTIITTGLPTTPARPEGVKVPLDRPIQIGQIIMTILGYGLGYEVSKEAMDDDLYNVIAEPASRFLAASMRDTEERLGHAVFNNAFTTQQSYDGVSLINATHTLQSGSTLANRPATDQALGFTSLQASLERFKQLTTERDLKIRMRPEKLFVPIQLWWLAEELLMSSQRPHQATNTTNVLASGRVGLTPMESEYLTSATAWFVLGPKGGRQGHKLTFFWRERPNMDKDFDKQSRVAMFMNFSRFGTVAWDYRGIDGSTG